MIDDDDELRFEVNEYHVALVLVIVFCAGFLAGKLF